MGENLANHRLVQPAAPELITCVRREHEVEDWTGFAFHRSIAAPLERPDASHSAAAAAAAGAAAEPVRIESPSRLRARAASPPVVAW